jgi:hypothetical protein
MKLEHLLLMCVLFMYAEKSDTNNASYERVHEKPKGIMLQNFEILMQERSIFFGFSEVIHFPPVSVYIVSFNSNSTHTFLLWAARVE